MNTVELDWVKCAHVKETEFSCGYCCYVCLHGKPHQSKWSCAVECGLCGCEDTCKPTTEDWEA